MTDLSQYQAVRTRMGLIDRSHTGKLAIRGTDRFPWLQGMVSSDVRLLENPQGVTRLPACVLDPTGHLLSDLALVKVRGSGELAASLGLAGEDFVLADLPRENVEKILTVFDRFVIMEDVEIKDVSAAVGCFSLQGPLAYALWDNAPDASKDPFREMWGRFDTAAADHTGSLGFDFYFPIEQKQELGELMERAGVPEIDLETQEVMRVEAGFPKYGADMDASVLALETGLGPTHISLTKGCYVGQEIIARIDSRGHTNRALTGLIVVEGDLPVPGDRLFFCAEGAAPRETGRLTSVVASAPAAQDRPIALGYVRHEHREPGMRLHVEGEGRKVLAEMVALPFYRRL
jgi:folate-binding protein YgfZ